MTGSKTANMSKGPYLFLLRRKFKAEVTNEKLGLKNEAIFSLFPPFQRCHAREIFLASSDDLTSQLSYNPKIDILASLY